MSPEGAALGSELGGLPRTCGDEPRYMDSDPEVIASAPHLRG